MTVVALEAKPSWSSLVWMDVSLLLMRRRIGAVLAGIADLTGITKFFA